MKVNEIIQEIFSWAQLQSEYTRHCDTLKAGSEDAEVKKVAVCCFPEVKAIKAAAEWGADLFISHEPLYFHEPDVRLYQPETPAGKAKQKIVEESGMTFYRYHDHPHMAPVDLICEGELKALNLKGTFLNRGPNGNNRMVLDTPMTPRQLAAHIEKALGIAHVRICGTTDEPCTKLSMGWGAPGGVLEDLIDDDVEIVLVGETCEWKMAEYARDAAQLGFRKALLILGHCGSERAGMKHVADRMQEAFPELEVKFFNSDEVYTYPEL